MIGRVMSMVAMPLGLIAADTAVPRVRDESVSRLATEVHGKGRIVFAARSEKGDWDLFLYGPVVRRHGERPGAILDHRTSQCECRERDGPLQLHAGLDARSSVDCLLARYCSRCGGMGQTVGGEPGFDPISGKYLKVPG